MVGIRVGRLATEYLGNLEVDPGSLEPIVLGLDRSACLFFDSYSCVLNHTDHVLRPLSFFSFLLPSFFFRRFT